MVWRSKQGKGEDTLNFLRVLPSYLHSQTQCWLEISFKISSYGKNHCYNSIWSLNHCLLEILPFEWSHDSSSICQSGCYHIKQTLAPTLTLTRAQPDHPVLTLQRYHQDFGPGLQTRIWFWILWKSTPDQSFTPEQCLLNIENLARAATVSHASFST